MKSEVILTVIEGKLTGQKFVFDERNTCIMGRNNDCYPKLPDDEFHRCISRYHCLLDINPPEIRIRDFGSKNGTFVNGKKIGQRADHETPEEGAKRNFPQYDLKDNDTITLSETVFQVKINPPLPPLEKGEDELENKTKETIDVFKIAILKEESEENKQKKPKINLFNQVQNLLVKALKGNKELKAISNYKLLEKIGKGGYGEVYLARNENTNQLVALKVMLPEVAEDQNAIDRFLREIANQKALKHPNIVELFDYGYSENIFFFTLEYCQGGSLQNYLKNLGRPLTIEEALPIILQVLDGLEYAHNAQIPYVKLADGTITKGKGLVHRDLKPDNILLTTNNLDYQIKIADFGLSKAFDLAGFSGLSVTNGTMGTPVFMPRQQVIDFKYAKPDADLWSLMAIFYYLITGKYVRKFTKGDSFYDILRNDPIPILKQNPNLPQKLAELIDLGLREKPEIYFKNAQDLKQALLNIKKLIN